MTCPLHSYAVDSEFQKLYFRWPWVAYQYDTVVLLTLAVRDTLIAERDCPVYNKTANATTYLGVTYSDYYELPEDSPLPELDIAESRLRCDLINGFVRAEDGSLEERLLTAKYKLGWILRRTKFEGASGFVELDAYGDRHLDFDWINLQADLKITYELSPPGESQVFEVPDISYVVVGNHFEDNDTTVLFPSTPIRWAGGSFVAPSDSVQQVFIEEKVDESVRWALGVLAGLVALCALLTIALSWYFRDLAIIRMSSPTINMLASFGVIVVMGTVVLAGAGASSAEMCKAQYWLASIGFTLSYAPLFSKTYRVHHIFNSKKLRVRGYGNGQLFFMVGLFVVVDVVILTMWMVLDPPQSRSRTLSVDRQMNDAGLLTDVTTYTLECTSDQITTWLSFYLVFKSVLLLTGAILAFMVRKVNIPALNDSKWIGLAIYNIALAYTFAVPVASVMKPTEGYVVLAAATVYSLAALLLLVHVPKLYAILQGQTVAWTAERKTSYPRKIVDDDSSEADPDKPRAASTSTVALVFGQPDQPTTSQELPGQNDVSFLKQENAALRRRVAVLMANYPPRMPNVHANTQGSPPSGVRPADVSPHVTPSQHSRGPSPRSLPSQHSFRSQRSNRPNGPTLSNVSRVSNASGASNGASNGQRAIYFF